MAQFTMMHRPAEKSSRLIDASPVYYGWVVTAAATIGMFMTIPGQTAGVSLFIDQIIFDLGLTRSTVSLTYTVATVLGATTLAFIGRQLDRFGPRKGVVVIVAGLAAACAVMSFASGLVTLFLGFFMLRAMGPGALGLVNIHAVNIWFVRKRGTAVGWMGIGIALATASYPLFVEHGLAGFDWRASFLIVGGILVVVMIPIGWIFFREHPEKYGVVPDGQSASGENEGEVSYTLAQARRAPAFWLLTACVVCVASLVTGLLFHHFDIMSANGLDRAAAAAVFVPLGIVTAGSNLFTGVLVDRVSPRLLMGVMLGLFAGLLAYVPFISSLAHVWIYGSGFGLVQGMSGALAGSAYAYYFGRRHIGAIKGLAQTLMVAGSAGGPVIYGVGFDLIGTYGPPLFATAALTGGLALTAFLITDRRIDPALPEPLAGD